MPVTFMRETQCFDLVQESRFIWSYSIWTNLSTDEFGFISLALFVGNEFWTIVWKRSSTILNIQMESNVSQDSTALALQVQTLITIIEELTRQNQEIRQQLQLEENRPPKGIETSRNEDEAQGPENSYERDGSRRTKWFDGVCDNLLRSIRKEMDELKSAMKEKTAKNLDGMVKRTDSPFTTNVLECPLPWSYTFLCLSRLPRFLVYLGIYRRIILSFVVHWITLKRIVCKGRQNF